MVRSKLPPQSWTHGGKSFELSSRKPKPRSSLSEADSTVGSVPENQSQSDPATSPVDRLQRGCVLPPNVVPDWLEAEARGPFGIKPGHAFRYRFPLSLSVDGGVLLRTRLIRAKRPAEQSDDVIVLRWINLLASS
jgi:hypothetical protein